MKKLKTSFARVRYRHKLLMVAVCVPIAVMGAKCQESAITCPNLKAYSKEQQARALAQYELVERQAPDLIIMVNDYIDLRSAIRKCIARRDK